MQVRTRGGLVGVSLAEHAAACANGISALPHHRDDGSRGEELGQTTEERLALEVVVVGGGHARGGGQKLHSNQLVALLLEALDDLADLFTSHET